MLTLGIVDGDEMNYHPDDETLTFKDHICKYQDLIDCVESSLDRIRVGDTDLILIKKQLTYKIGCLEISIKDFNRYNKIIKRQKRQKSL